MHSAMKQFIQGRSFRYRSMSFFIFSHFFHIVKSLEVSSRLQGWSSGVLDQPRYAHSYSALSDHIIDKDVSVERSIALSVEASCSATPGRSSTCHEGSRRFRHDERYIKTPFASDFTSDSLWPP